MKKSIMFLAMSAMVFYASAQTTEVPAEPGTTGQGVRAVAQETESNKEKGQVVSQTANVKGTEMSAEAKAKVNAEESIDASKNEAPENKGQEVKAVATDASLVGQEKGEAVKAVAATQGETRKNKVSRSETGKTKRNTVAKQRKSTQQRSATRAKRPATTGRSTNTGRPGN